MPNDRIHADLLAIVGVAGSGKSTVASELVRAVETTCWLMSGGQYLRGLAAAGDEEAGLLVQSGSPMSPEQFGDFVSSGVSQLQVLPELIILDGNPRDAGQAKVIPRLGFRSFSCIVIDVPGEMALSRIEARASAAPRPDDDLSVARQRVTREKNGQFELLQILREYGEMVVIDGTQEPTEIVAQIIDELKLR